MKLISINPATNETIGSVNTAASKTIPKIVASLREKFLSWKNSELNTRTEIINKAAELIRKQSDEISKLVSTEQGKLFSEAKGEVDNAADRLDYFANTAPKALEPIEENLANVRSVTRFQPLGVVAAIKPWNFPIGIPVWSIAPALLAGNTVLFKPSERTPLIGHKLFEIFLEAGLPDGVMQIVHGAEEVGKAIVASNVDMIAFVGSQAVGKYIMANSTHNFRKLALELGGKDAMIVCADCDLEKTVGGAIAGVFKNCGQVCCSVERIFVDEKIFNKFSSAVLGKIANLKMGPLNRLEDVKRVERLLRDAVKKGAKIITGGKRIKSKGFFFEPTLITNVTDKMALLNEEVFGPVMTLIPFKNLDEAIANANSTIYGLGASVWSADLNKSDAIAKKLEAGTIAINQVVASIVECPWGGVKSSGIGRMLGPEAAREFTETVNYRYLL